MKYFFNLLLFIYIGGILLAGNNSVIYYSPSDENFFNPERGFLSQVAYPLTLWRMNHLKGQNISVIQRLYIIPEYHDTVLPESFLEIVKEDLNVARQGGLKLVIRFSYTRSMDGKDAALDTILIHIDQLKPILQENYDVIAFMEAGFIGAYGEWCYSSHGLNNTEARRTVLFALLDALPSDRYVAIRTPDYKRKIFNDLNPISLENAFNKSYKSRTGAHNDCFLASATDYGTYLENNIEEDKNYLNQDNLYVPQGGEACTPSEYSHCSNALIDFARIHWSVINKEYNRDVLEQWENEGCMEEIKRRLGYRFQLLNAVLPDSIKPGGAFQLNFKIENLGFASPYNNRLLEIILRNTIDRKVWRFVTNEDLRFWAAGDTMQVTIEGGIPLDIAEGNYEVLLHLADPVDTLRYRPEYAIRLANENVWEDSTGYNSLQHQIIISKRAPGEDYIGDNFFEYFHQSSQLFPHSKIQIDGNFHDWDEIPQLDITPDEEDAGDALDDASDLLNIWATNDENYLYISYQLVGSRNGNYFYHILIDADQDTSTGFHSKGSYAGIDMIIENQSIWKYSGENNEWSWTYLDESLQGWGHGATRIELAINRNLLTKTVTGKNIDLIFNVDELNEDHFDDYAPNSFTTRSYSYSFTITAINVNEPVKIPNKMQLRIYPNPFNNHVTIEIKITDKGVLNGSIYDINGRKIKSFKRTDILSGKIVWDGTNNRNKSVGSGLYIFRLSGIKTQIVEKLILLK